MSSALKQPVLSGAANQSPNAPTPANVTSQIGLNKNIQQVTANLPLNSATQNKALSATSGNLPSLGNSASSQPSVKPFTQPTPSAIPSQPTYPSLLSHSQSLHTSNQNAATSANQSNQNQAQQPADGVTPSVQHKQLNSSSSIGSGGNLSTPSPDVPKVTPTPAVSSSPHTQPASSTPAVNANASTPAITQQKSAPHANAAPSSVTANTSPHTSPVKSAVQSNGAVESTPTKPIASHTKEEQTTTPASVEHSKTDTTKKETNDTKIEPTKEVVKETEKVTPPTKPSAPAAPTPASNAETSNSVTSSNVGGVPPPTTKLITQVQTPDSVVTSAVQNSSSSSSLSQSPVQNTTTQSPKSDNQKTPTRTMTTPTSTTTPTSKPAAATSTAPTTPRSATKRKRESTSKTAETPPKAAKLESAVTPRSQKLSLTIGKSDDQKGKRLRVPTQPYQSPLPEMTIISKIGARLKNTPNAEDKLIAFFKNEFLAVRNTEGGFYVCQAVQNVKKTSSKIRIRWLSNQDKTSNIYTPDFYDYTEFDCILTNLKLNKLEKGRFRLPKEELERTENILKRALDVEQGVETEVSLTEEHPDGLDISLLTDENQVKGKSKRTSPKAQKRKASGGGKVRSAKKVKPIVLKTKTIKEKASKAESKKVGAKTSEKLNKGKSTIGKSKKVESKPVEKVLSSTSSQKKGPSSRSQRYQSRKGNAGASGTSPVVDAKKAKVLAKVAGHKPTASTSKAVVKPVKSNAKTKKAKVVTAPVPSTSGRSARHLTSAVSSTVASTSSRRLTSGRRAGKK